LPCPFFAPKKYKNTHKSFKKTKIPLKFTKGKKEKKKKEKENLTHCVVMG
jgi:hypothetical protein